LQHRVSVKRFVSIQHFDLRQSVGLLGRGISASECRYLIQTQNKHKYIYALCRIRTHDPSVLAGEDISCLRTRGRYDRQ
jgi:hypothetical protein